MALASQSMRPHSVPRSSQALRSRAHRGRGKRVVGFVLLGGLSAAMAFWFIGARDGHDGSSPAAANSPGTLTANAPAPGDADTSPSTTTLLTASPLHAAPVHAAAPASIEMGVPSSRFTPAQAGASPLPPVPGYSPPAPTPVVNDPLTSTPPSPSPSPAPSALSSADRAQQQGRLPEVRTQLNRALLDPATGTAERADLRRRISELNQTLLFGPAQFPGDPFTETYTVVSGDKLNKIARKLALLTEPSLIARVNRMANPNALRIGQTLKLVRGPFHAVVSKSAFRMDLYAGPTPGPSSLGTSTLPDGAEPGWTYLCSFPVGLGDKGTTPIANFSVTEGSKLIDPHWANPRTGERFAADNPLNPIGERWMGLEGVDARSRAYTGYGIHGTIDPSSIGREMSMGCIRMAAADVEIVYELLTGRVSVVKIVP